MLCLGLFLEIKLAFWVTLGIPISFVGAMLFLPSTDISINMISLFAFIVVLGLVVDDAIVVGEAVYKRRQDGATFMEAAIHGTREVAMPVIFAIITTVMAFSPLLFVPGPAGKFFRVIPIVVIAVLLLSLMECLIILPAHLAHSKKTEKRGVYGFIHHLQQRFSRFLERNIHRLYEPFVNGAARRRYLTVAVSFAIFIATIGFVAGGRLKFTFLPKVDADVITATAELPYGSSVERTTQVNQRMQQVARELLAEYGGEEKLSRGMFSQVGAGGQAGMGSPNGGSQATTGSHLASTSVFLVGSGVRPMTAREFAHKWRDRLAEIPGVERMSFRFETGPSAGEAINVELSHPDMATLQRASRDLAVRLEEFSGVYEVDDGFSDGKEQLNLHLKPGARALGVTEADLARQVRSAFFGAEAVRQQRGRDEVRVYVRLPKHERESEYNIEELILRTPLGGEILLGDAAVVTRGRSYTSIKRIDGRQAVAVTGNVDDSAGNAVEIMARVGSEVLPALQKKYPGLYWSVGGEEKERSEIFASLGRGFLLAVLAMFALLAIAFRSYVQPIIILLAIPFGFVGAVWGHMLMGYDLSLMSMMGVVALAGVVVNDSLILIVAINQFRAEGMPLFDAVAAGGVRRFRPILLTSLTTFFGLAPMIVETSVQAKFLIPMAVSLGFGVLFATAITLVLVPAVYVIVDDAKRGIARLRPGEPQPHGSLPSSPAGTVSAPEAD
jgi:multidrug efflux pump subunit AcrB